MKQFSILCLSIFLLSGCYYCDDCQYVYPTDGKYYYPPVQHQTYTVRAKNRTQRAAYCGNYGYYQQPVNPCNPCANAQQQTKRAVGTVYEISTYETRCEPKTIKTGTYRQTEYNTAQGCVDPCAPMVTPKEPVRKKPNVRAKPYYIDESYVGDDAYLIK